jgi:hypothetical protein
VGKAKLPKAPSRCPTPESPRKGEKTEERARQGRGAIFCSLPQSSPPWSAWDSGQGVPPCRGGVSWASHHLRQLLFSDPVGRAAPFLSRGDRPFYGGVHAMWVLPISLIPSKLSFIAISVCFYGLGRRWWCQRTDQHESHVFTVMGATV